MNCFQWDFCTFFSGKSSSTFEKDNSGGKWKVTRGTKKNYMNHFHLKENTCQIHIGSFTYMSLTLEGNFEVGEGGGGLNYKKVHATIFNIYIMFIFANENGKGSTHFSFWCLCIYTCNFQLSKLFESIQACYLEH